MHTVVRIIVGASGSPGSLRALRYAQHLARDFDATLVPVLAWLPPCGDVADRRTPDDELRRIWVGDAHQKLQDTLNLAWGTPPADPPVQPLVRRGHPGPVLAVPPTPLARQARHGALVRAVWRRTLTIGQISPGMREATA